MRHTYMYVLCSKTWHNDMHPHIWTDFIDNCWLTFRFNSCVFSMFLFILPVRVTFCVTMYFVFFWSVFFRLTLVYYPCTWLPGKIRFQKNVHIIVPNFATQYIQTLCYINHYWHWHYRTVLIIFPRILQTIIIAQMLWIRGKLQQQQQ